MKRTVKTTHWKAPYVIVDSPVDDKHSRITVRLLNGRVYESKMLFKNGDEFKKAAEWLEDYTATSHLYKILDRFKEVIDTPFDTK